MSDSAFRPRGATEIVDGAFQIYRRHLGTILVVSGLAYLPSLLVRLLVVGAAPTAMGAVAMRFLGGMVLAAIAALLAYTLMSGVVIRLGADVFLGGRADAGRALRATIGRVPALLGAWILRALATAAPVVAVGIAMAVVLPAFVRGGARPGATAIVALGVLLLLAVAGMAWVTATFFATGAAVVLESLGPAAALSRSAELADGRRPQIFGTLALVVAIYIGFVLVGAVLAAVTGSLVANALVNYVVPVIVYPLIALTELLLYYDARIRGEALDVELMAASLGAAPGEPAALR